MRWADEARLRFILFTGISQGAVSQTTTLYRCVRALPEAFRPGWQGIVHRAERGGFHEEVTFERGTWWVHIHPEMVRLYGLRTAIVHALRPRL
jgi:hypothetical protein